MSEETTTVDKNNNNNSPVANGEDAADADMPMVAVPPTAMNDAATVDQEESPSPPVATASVDITPSSEANDDDDHDEAKRPSSAIAAEDAPHTDHATDPPAWDHSNRRVMVQGVDKFYDTKKIRRLFQQWIDDINQTTAAAQNIKDGEGGRTPPLVLERAKKAPSKSWALAIFAHPDMVQPFIDYVNGKQLRAKNGRILYAQRSAPNSRGDTATAHKKRGLDEVANDGGGTNETEDGENDRGGKRQDRKESVAILQRPVTEDEIKDKVCPLWRMGAEEQLELKNKEMVRKSALRIVADIKAKIRKLEREKKEKIPYFDWMKRSRPIDVRTILPVPSPIRNKVEFTFGYRYVFDETMGDADQGGTIGDSVIKEPTKVPAVGFMVRGWAGGVGTPKGCPNIGPEFCAVADLMDDFLKDSPLPPYDPKAHTGFWRLLTIRVSRRTRQCMVIVVHSPFTGGPGETVDWTSQMAQERERLVKVLKDAKLPVPNQDPILITSAYLQEYDGVSNPKPEDPVQLLYGKSTLEEQLGKCTFHISPGAFFQVNTVGAEILYGQVVEKVRQVSDNAENTLLFDVCCGTGTIGLTCMKEGVVGKVVGIDMSEPAIKDARENALANGFTNNAGTNSMTRFVAARAENAMQKEISKASQSAKMNFVAVVDPARVGLHADVIRALRSTEDIGRIVYVSCNPTGSLVNDATLLCTPPTKKYRGTPFQVTFAQPVDMFPFTSHCEMVMVFDRVGAKKNETPTDPNEVVGKSEKVPQPK